MQNLTESLFFQLATRHYDNIQCSCLSEYNDDLKRFSYLKKLLSKYKDTGNLKVRLILNHIITISNLFGIVAPELLFYKINKENHNTLATFLIALNLMPDDIPSVNVKKASITIDTYVLKKIQEL